MGLLRIDDREPLEAFIRVEGIASAAGQQLSSTP